MTALHVHRVPGILIALVMLLLGAFFVALLDPGSPDGGKLSGAAVGEVKIESRPGDPRPGPWSHPDAPTIRLWSEAAGVPWVFSYAIAWEETRNNVAPTSRSYMGAVGRFQIMPATAKARCPGLNIYTSTGNLSCFLKLTRETVAGPCAGDWRCVARAHNGSGHAAEVFADSVMSGVRQLVTREIER